MNGWLCPFWASHTPVDGEKLAFFVSALTLTVKKMKTRQWQLA